MTQLLTCLFIDLLIFFFFATAADVEPNLFEGDIVLSPNPDESSSNDQEREKRNAQRLRRYIWTAKIVPYEISDILSEMFPAFSFLVLL